MDTSTPTTIAAPRHRGIPRELPPIQASWKHIDLDDVRPETTRELLAAIEGRIAESLDLFLAIEDLDEDGVVGAIATAGHGRLYEAFEAIGQFRPQINLVLEVKVSSGEHGLDVAVGEPTTPDPFRDFANAVSPGSMGGAASTPHPLDEVAPGIIRSRAPEAPVPPTPGLNYGAMDDSPEDR